MGTITAGVKQANRISVLKYVIEKKSVSRQDIAKDLGLSMPTVISNVTELMERGYLCEAGEYESSGGRKAKAISVTRDFRSVVGMDITKRHIRLVLMDLSGVLLGEESRRFVYADTSEYYREVGAYLEEFLDGRRVDRERLLGVGIALPGIVNDKKTVLLKSHILNIEGVDLQNFCRNIQYPTTFDNDANCAAFAEVNKEEPCTTYFSLSNTVGGTIYFNGQLCSGKMNKSGELGHMIIHPRGKRCYCGKQGCVDAYCSAASLLDNPDDRLESFFETLASGDPRAAVRWDEYLDDLAIAVTNIRMALDCSIILGGYMGEFIEESWVAFSEKAKKYNNFERDVEYITIGKHKRLASAIGAAQLMREQHINGMVF